MRYVSRWEISNKDKKNYIELLTPHLTVLRAKAGISQDELSKLIGVSRQTYGAVERGLSELSWNTYLALLLFFYENSITRPLLRQCGACPDELIRRFNPDGVPDADQASSPDAPDAALFGGLDEQGKRTIHNMAMVEYARANSMSLEAVVKAFEGMDAVNSSSNPAADSALAAIKKKKV
ncbi:MAG: helix-turn-helix domain-containing protein [Lachnospiraceae bacterium]|nr:helix-turn-helix domain-containing protein [Lachnospiraceae bacterium]